MTDRMSLVVYIQTKEDGPFDTPLDITRPFLDLASATTAEGWKANMASGSLLSRHGWDLLNGRGHQVIRNRFVTWPMVEQDSADRNMAAFDAALGGHAGLVRAANRLRREDALERLIPEAGRNLDRLKAAQWEPDLSRFDMVYHEDLDSSRDGYAHADELDTVLPLDGSVAFVFGTSETGFAVDAETLRQEAADGWADADTDAPDTLRRIAAGVVADVVETACNELHDDAAEQVVETEELERFVAGWMPHAGKGDAEDLTLEPFLEAWNAKQTIRSFMVDYGWVCPVSADMTHADAIVWQQAQLETLEKDLADSRSCDLTGRPMATRKKTLSLEALPGSNKPGFRLDVTANLLSLVPDDERAWRSLVDDRRLVAERWHQLAACRANSTSGHRFLTRDMVDEALTYQAIADFEAAMGGHAGLVLARQRLLRETLLADRLVAEARRNLGWLKDAQWETDLGRFDMVYHDDLLSQGDGFVLVRTLQDQLPQDGSVRFVFGTHEVGLDQDTDLAFSVDRTVACPVEEGISHVEAIAWQEGRLAELEAELADLRRRELDGTLLNPDPGSAEPSPDDARPTPALS